MGSVISSVGNMFGAGPGGDTNGLNYEAHGTTLDRPTTVDQANTAYGQTQDALNQQAAFVQALQAQGGLQNQADVYGQLQGVANGTGPNPAQAMLNQATGNNIASTAALMAGQRGVSANPGMIARQIGQQGANIGQQAAGQGAALQAQQSLNAINSAGNIAGQQVANQANATTGYNQAAQSEQQNLLNGIQGQNNADVSMQNNLNSSNASVSNSLIPVQNKHITDAFSNIPGLGKLFAHGGEVPKYADGGQVDPSGPQSFVGQHFSLFGSAPSNMSNQGTAPDAAPVPQSAPVAADDSSSGPTGIPSQFSGALTGGLPGGSASGVMAGGPMDAVGAGAGGADLAGAAVLVNKGGVIKKPVNGEMLAAKGKEVPGKPKVKGDSLKNDTVDAKLSPGEIVIPRSISQGKDAPRKAAEFVAAVLAKKGLR